MGRDPLRSMARSMAEAVEHSPAFTATAEGNGVVAWAGLKWATIANARE